MGIWCSHAQSWPGWDSRNRQEGSLSGVRSKPRAPEVRPKNQNQEVWSLFYSDSDFWHRLHITQFILMFVELLSDYLRLTSFWVIFDVIWKFNSWLATLLNDFLRRKKSLWYWLYINFDNFELGIRQWFICYTRQFKGNHFTEGQNWNVSDEWTNYLNTSVVPDISTERTQFKAKLGLWCQEHISVTET